MRQDVSLFAPTRHKKDVRTVCINSNRNAQCQTNGTSKAVTDVGHFVGRQNKIPQVINYTGFFYGALAVSGAILGGIALLRD
ncbi:MULTISPECIES: hypothetical protein [unclassified Caballeronia]|uniref:hypothetical protein n=1 Tax=unclassified Caballeronia TaxID=2646786 RepID=UPI0020280C4E|nr:MULTISPECIES: hypothetical protein [unclassified Caballeronia]